MNFIYIKLILLSLLTTLVVADDCSVIQDILTQNNVEITWNPSNSTGCCSFEGINCVNDRVVQINFGSKGYTGNIESLMPLTSLQYINLSNCRFTGSIPSSIQEMYNLQFFYVDRNQLTGTIPSEIAISNLQFIDLSGNQLEGQIPSSLGKVINLQHVNFSNNNLSGNVPSSFRSLKNIQSLHLSGNRQLCGELPYLSDTLKECNFGSTSLCINGSRSHCTNNIKSCDSVNCNGESKTSTKVTSTKTQESTSVSSDDNSNNNSSNSNIDNNNSSDANTNTDTNTNTNTNTTLGPEDFSDANKESSKDKILRYVAIGFVILLILCIIILLLICMKKRCRKPITIDKPDPGRSNHNHAIFDEEYEHAFDVGEDPDASIQIHSLSKPQQVVVPVDEGISQSQISSYDESSQYESIGGASSNYESLNNYSNSQGRSPINTHSIVNQGIYPNSLNKSQNHLTSPGTPVDSIEQDLGDIVLHTNGSIMSENSHGIGTTSITSPPPNKVSSSIYAKSQSSPNLVRLNRYSAMNQNPSPTGPGKRRMTNASIPINPLNEPSPKLISSVNSSPTIDSKRSKHSSIPYPISPFAMKSSSLNQRKTYDTKRKQSTGNEEGVHHNTVHVVNSRKSIPYSIEKSPTTATKITNYSESGGVSSQNNLNHSTTPLTNKGKNRTSLPPMNTKRPSVLTKFSSQNSMNASPLASSTYDIPSASDGVDSYPVNINKTSINPSTISSNTTNTYSLNDVHNKVSNETFPKVVSPSLNQNRTSLNIPSQNVTVIPLDHSYQSSDDNSPSHLNTSLDTNPSSSYNNYIKPSPNLNIVNTHISNNNSSLLEDSENPTEEMYINSIEDANKPIEEEYKQYEQEELYDDYEYENIPEDLREQIEEPQPPNYEEVFSETMYSPFIEANANDEAIRMQLEMRRIEERQLRMEYLQRQIDNPELTSAQRQKYIDALDRLMLE